MNRLDDYDAFDYPDYEIGWLGIIFLLLLFIPFMIMDKLTDLRLYLFGKR